MPFLISVCRVMAGDPWAVQAGAGDASEDLREKDVWVCCGEQLYVPAKCCARRSFSAVVLCWQRGMVLARRLCVQSHRAACSACGRTELCWGLLRLRLGQESDAEPAGSLTALTNARGAVANYFTGFYHGLAPILEAHSSACVSGLIYSWIFLLH